MNSIQKKIISVFAPATVANVGPAFDIMGFAVSSPGDTVTLETRDEPGIEITEIIGDDGRLPKDAKLNTAGVAILELLKSLNKTTSIGFNVSIKKDLPLGSGMGSSAASSVAAAVAANHLLGEPLSRSELLPFAMEAERIACGSAHADNVAPALFGGFVLIRSYDPLDVIKLPCPEDLFSVLIHPEIEVRTEDARKVLRGNISIKKLVTQTGNIAGLISSLYSNDYELLSRSLNDVIVEPERAILITGFYKVKQSAISNGALGCSISGSGPSIFALCKGLDTAKKVSEEMRSAFSSISIESTVYISEINRSGATVISKNY